MAEGAIKSVSIIGAGNVATHLALGLNNRNFSIKEIWSKNISNAELLAKKINANVCSNLSQLNIETNLVIISVKDDSLEEVVAMLPAHLPAVVHTSGSLDMKILNETSNHIGVLYPLQSFNKDEAVNWKEVPICVEANSDHFTEQLFSLSKSLSGHVEYLNSTQRIQLHIAAIFANNFSNYIYSLAYQLATKQHLPFSLLIPLIQQTTNRLGNTDPFQLQTGPAKRNDVELIKKHIELLSSNKEAQEVYEFLSEEIRKKERNEF